MVDLTKFTLSADPDDPVNSVVMTGDIGRLSTLFVSAHPFVDWATPLNAEAEHSKELLKNPNAGPPLTDSERNRQSWKMPTYVYRSLYEAVVMRGEKKFNPANARPPRSSDMESTVSSMSSMPAPPGGKATSSSGGFVFKKPRSLSAAQPAPAPAPAPALSTQFQHDTSAALKTISKDVATLKEKLQYSMQVMLDIRDALVTADENDDAEVRSSQGIDDLDADIVAPVEEGPSGHQHIKKRKASDD